MNEIDVAMTKDKVHDYMLVICLKRGYVKWREVANFFSVEFTESLDRKFRIWRKQINKELRLNNKQYRFYKKVGGKKYEKGIQLLTPEEYEKALEIEGKKAFSEKGKEKRSGGKGQQKLKIG